MKHFKLKSYFLILLIGFSIASCSDDDTEETPTTPTAASDNSEGVFDISNTGATAYNFDFTLTENPELELTRGESYEFKINSPGHPFLINTINTLGTGNSYQDGVTNNGTANGSILFTVPNTAPDLLWYNCEFHAPMAGRIRIVNAGDTSSFQVGNTGPTAYTFSGNGFTNVANTNFTFKRGNTYTFNVSTPGHPFLLKDTQGTGTGNTYDSGVTNNGVENGTLTFTVPQNAPNTLYYVCEFHGSMTGTISIID